MDIDLLIKCLEEIKENKGNVKVLLQDQDDCRLGYDISNLKYDEYKNVLIIK